MTIKRSRAIVQSTIVVRDKTANEETHRDTKTQVKMDKRVDGEILTARAGVGITITYGYQSVRIDVSGESPYKADDKDARRKAYDELYEFIDEEIANRSVEIDELVRELARKYK